tara:strand:- start:21669 stop:22676 length:1008 start_codon:yes stop_codon:yes gene_type:complete
MIKHIVKQSIIFFIDLLKTSRVSLKKPIFIWGLYRGGTTLLMDIISLHPDLCFATTKKREKKGLWGSLHYGDNSSTNLKKYEIPVEGLVRNWFNTGFDFKNSMGEIKRDALNDTQKLIVKKNYLALKKKFFFLKNKKEYRIMDKAGYITMIDLIEEIFPDAIHVFSIRDPRNVINSFMRLIRFTSPDIVGKQMKDGIEAYKFEGWEKIKHKPTHQIIAWQICKAVEIGMKWKSKLGDRCVLWRHEYLYNQPNKNLTKLFKKLELSLNKNILNVLPKEYNDYSTKWPLKNMSFSPNFDFCFSSQEFLDLDNIQKKAIELGYHKRIPGKLVKDIYYG